MSIASFLRATAFVALSASLVFAIAHRRVLAQVDEALLVLGSSLMVLPADSVEEARTLVVNGVSLQFRVQSVAAPIQELMRHYRGACATGAEPRGAYAPMIASLATRSWSNGSEGYVACVDTGAGDLETLARRLANFSKSWDVADAGLPRYVYARKQSQDPASRTFIFTMWADGSMNLRDLLPPGGGDARGADPTDVPRLPGSRRILSARETGAPSQVYLYVTPRAPGADIGAFYRRELPMRGWALVERRPGEVTEIDGTRVLSAERSGRTITLLVHPHELEQMLVTILATEAG